MFSCELGEIAENIFSIDNVRMIASEYFWQHDIVVGNDISGMNIYARVIS